MVITIPFSSRHLRSCSRLAAIILAGFAVAMLCTASANAALREYRMQFIPSSSASATGYTLHVGTTAGAYEAEFDLGLPPLTGATVIYALDLDDVSDLYVALRSYDSSGLSSVFSNEIRVEAFVAPPPPPPPTDGGGDNGGDNSSGGNDTPTDGSGDNSGGNNNGDDSSNGGSTGGGSGGGMGGGGMGGGDAGNDMLSNLFHIGMTSSNTGLISTILGSGDLEFLTMDSLAARENLRPIQCDLDGDSDDDIVVGFGAGSQGQVALIFIENGAVVSVSTLVAGPEEYRRVSGRTNPGCGDLDGDGRAEIVIGFGLRMRGVVQVFDDVQTGFAPLSSARSGAQGYMQIPVPTQFWGSTYPAIGDIDGDGRDELVIGLGRTTGGGRLIVLDDLQAGFAIHPGNQTGEPWLRVDPSLERKMGRTRTMPAVGDLDGDGRDEIAVSFGKGSRAMIAILEDAIDGLPRTPSDALLIAAGRTNYRHHDGATRVAIGDVDNDGVEELVVGFQRGGRHELQVFDGLGSGMSTPMTADDGFISVNSSSKRVYPLPVN